jgi:hypothetical protein
MRPRRQCRRREGRRRRAENPTLGVHTEPGVQHLRHPILALPSAVDYNFFYTESGPQLSIPAAAAAVPPCEQRSMERGAITGSTPPPIGRYPAPHTLLPCLPPCARLCAPSR